MVQTQPIKHTTRTNAHSSPHSPHFWLSLEEEEEEMTTQDLIRVTLRDTILEVIEPISFCPKQISCQSLHRGLSPLTEPLPDCSEPDDLWRELCGVRVIDYWLIKLPFKVKSLFVTGGRSAVTVPAASHAQRLLWFPRNTLLTSRNFNDSQSVHRGSLNQENSGDRDRMRRWEDYISNMAPADTITQSEQEIYNQTYLDFYSSYYLCSSTPELLGSNAVRSFIVCKLSVSSSSSSSSSIPPSPVPHNLHIQSLPMIDLFSLGQNSAWGPDWQLWALSLSVVWARQLRCPG